VLRAALTWSARAVALAAVPAAAQDPAALPAPLQGEGAAAEVIVMPGAKSPAPASHTGVVGPPAYRSQLPPETPDEQINRDPALPVTTLVEALERAYWTNPALVAERARTRSVDFRLPQARGQYGPQLQYSAEYGFQRDYTERGILPPLTRSGWSSTANAVLSLPLFTFGRNRANENSAQAQIAFQRSSLLVAEQQTLLDVISAYAMVLRDRASADITESYVDLLTSELSDSRSRLQARDTTIVDVRQVETRLELARSELLVAQRAAASSDALFLRLVGSPAGDLAALNPLILPVSNLEEAYAFADGRNPVVASAYARERVSRAQTQLARAQLLPRVDLEGQGAIGTVTPYSSSLRQTELRGAVTLTGTLDSGIRAARVREASAANEADWRLIDDALRENRGEVADAWNTWQGQAAAVGRLELAAQSASRAYEGAQLQQRAGLRTTTEILDLARDLLQVRSNLNAGMAAAFVQQARLLAALGALRLDFLLPDARIYDPEVHYDRVKHAADVPLVTPLLRTLDSVALPKASDRTIRDPSGPLGSGGPTSATPEDTVDAGH